MFWFIFLSTRRSWEESCGEVSKSSGGSDQSGEASGDRGGGEDTGGGGGVDGESSE